MSDLILVRASSLGCRKGWAHDLWEQGSASADNQGTITIGPLRPATEDELAAIIKSSDNPVPPSPPKDASPISSEIGEDGQDFVVGAAPSPHSFRPRLVPASERAIPEDQSANAEAQASADAAAPPDQRASILRAREVQRARLANRIRPMIALLDPTATELGSVLPATTKPETPKLSSIESRASNEPLPANSSLKEGVADGADAIVPRPPLVPVPPVPVAELRPRQRAPEADGSAGEGRFDSIPQRDPDFVLPIRQQRPGTRIVSTEWHDQPQESEDNRIDSQPAIEAALGASDAELPRLDYDRPSDPDGDEVWYPKPEFSSGRSRHRRPGFSFRFRRHPQPSRLEEDRHLYSEVGHLEPIAVDHVHWSEELPNPPANESSRDWFESEAASEDGWQARGWTERSDWEEDASLALVEHFPPESEHNEAWHVVVADDNYGESLAGPITFDAATNDYVIAPDIPRMCRTCRDFRPADGGERGWCTSPWAFEHRRMVSGWELPCESALGSWWLPNDAVWADEYSEHHSDPTPLLDSLLTTRFSAPKRRAAGRRRRR